MTDRMPAAQPACAARVVPVRARSETRTRWVVGVTAVTMVAELVFGWLSGSLALLADGWHMATHVGALGLSAAAYWFARTRASEPDFAFGTGKVFALAGYTSAGLLLAAAVAMLVSAGERLYQPVSIHFAEALPVAVLGLLVNLVCAWLLGGAEGGHDHAHGHDHGHDHDHDHGHGHDHPPAAAHGHDHNLRAAYLHVAADALTSVMAIAAICAVHFLGWSWADPAAAVLGAVMIARWSLGLLRDSARQLVDHDPSGQRRDKVRAALEALDGTRVDDLHLWRVGPGLWVCVVSVVAQAPRPVEEYRRAVLEAAHVEHLTVEVRGAASA